jgi:hypothetical protein
MIFENADINTLKREVEYKVGRKIVTSKDCIELSEGIFVRTQFRINSNTLRRFFGLVKSEYPASIGTLNILSLYCGASSFEDLVAYQKTSVEPAINETPKLLKYLVSLFREVSVPNINDPTFIKVAHATIDFLIQHKEIAYSFQKEVAGIANGRRFYFEQFVNIDKLNSFYGAGLRYYLAESGQEESQVFGHSLLCLRYWLTGEHVKLESHYKQLIAFDVSEEFDLFTCARYFAAKLFYAEAKKLNTLEVIWEANAFYLNLKSSDQYSRTFPCFEIVFAEALILTGYYAEALVYTSVGSRRSLDGAPPYVDKELFKNFKLYHAIVLFNLGNEKKASDLFDQILPSEFYFITKQFNTILYLLLGQKLRKIRIGNEQIEFLLEQTGFARIAKL